MFNQIIHGESIRFFDLTLIVQRRAFRHADSLVDKYKIIYFRESRFKEYR